LRLLYNLVYKQAFVDVQQNHHHSAPLMAGESGLPMQWKKAFNGAVTKAGSSAKPRYLHRRPHAYLHRTHVPPPHTCALTAHVPSLRQPHRHRFTHNATATHRYSLEPETCKPLVELLDKYAEKLGGRNGSTASEACKDLLDQVARIEHYFGFWNHLQYLPHAMCDEIMHPYSPPTSREDERRAREAANADERPEAWCEYLLLAQAYPSEAAIAAAKRGLEEFEKMLPFARDELTGSLPWLCFSEKLRDGRPNDVYAEAKAFARGEINPVTGNPLPYRCFPKLMQTLVAGGAKYAPVNSAQLESLFTALPRQQGASKHNMTQEQMSYEARSVKNETIARLTVRVLAVAWSPAQRLKAALKNKGFWRGNVMRAARRKLEKDNPALVVQVQPQRSTDKAPRAKRASEDSSEDEESEGGESEADEGEEDEDESEAEAEVSLGRGGLAGV
jgi:hypothetical protein